MSIAHGKNRRRKFESLFDMSVKAYTRGAGTLPPFVDNLQETPMSAIKGLMMNHIWMFFYSFNLPGAQRWSDWNSKFYIDSNPVQKVEYLPQI